MKHADELLALGKFLLLEQAEAFDMENWRYAWDTDCGFAGCAIGHLPLVCPDTGLEMELIQGCSDEFFPYFDGFEQYEAIKEYFEISYSDARYLFDPSEYRRMSPFQDEVGERILKYLEELDQPKASEE